MEFGIWGSCLTGIEYLQLKQRERVCLCMQVCVRER